jgi:hypothetical protein
MSIDDALEDSFASDDSLHEDALQNIEGSSMSPYGAKEMSPVFLEQMEAAVSRLKVAVVESKNMEKHRLQSVEEKERESGGRGGGGVNGESGSHSNTGIPDSKSLIKNDVKGGVKGGEKKGEDDEDEEEVNYNDMSGSQDEEDVVLVDDESVSEEVEEEEIAEERSEYDNEQFDLLEASLDRSQNSDVGVLKNVPQNAVIEAVKEEVNSGNDEDRNVQETVKKVDENDDDQLDEVEVEVEVGGVDPFSYEKSFDSSVTISWICPDGNAARNLFTEKVREHLNIREIDVESMECQKIENLKKYGIASLGNMADRDSVNAENIKLPLKFQPKGDDELGVASVDTEIDSDSSQNNISEEEKKRRKEEKKEEKRRKEEEINGITEAIFLRLIEGEKQAVSVLYNQSSPIHTPSPYSSPSHSPSKTAMNSINTLSYNYENEDSSSDFPYRSYTHKKPKEESENFNFSPDCSPEKQKSVDTSESALDLQISPARIIAMLQPLPSSASSSSSLCSLSAMPSLTHPAVRSAHHPGDMVISRKELDGDLDDLYGFNDISVSHDNKIVMNKKDENAR